jgi:hypothetical protein
MLAAATTTTSPEPGRHAPTNHPHSRHPRGRPMVTRRQRLSSELATHQQAHQQPKDLLTATPRSPPRRGQHTCTAAGRSWPAWPRSALQHPCPTTAQPGPTKPVPSPPSRPGSDERCRGPTVRSEPPPPRCRLHQPVETADHATPSTTLAARRSRRERPPRCPLLC